ncbi:MAG: hypothetical protein KAJ49_03045 [Arcobacteraceae bacterium]|nr:hypothetical protein [Arcobacteraceae bacterium]
MKKYFEQHLNEAINCLKDDYGSAARDELYDLEYKIKNDAELNDKQKELYIQNVIKLQSATMPSNDREDAIYIIDKFFKNPNNEV